MKTWLLITLTLSIMIFAQRSEAGITIDPEELYPGDAFIVRVNEPLRKLKGLSFNGREFAFSTCGDRCSYAIGGVDIDTMPGVYSAIIHFKDNKRVTKKLRVKKATFPVINIELPEDKVTLSPEDEARANREEELLKSLWKIRSERLWQGGFIKPLENEVSTGFGIKRIINSHKLSIHKGIDIKARDGEPVRAVNNGRVLLTKELFFGGKTIVIDHGDSLFSVYMHLSEYKVMEGDTVSKGEIIGLAGSTGRTNGPHLHFTFKIGDLSINPESVFRLKLILSSLSL
jgi:murein DD-endopeptidase MepM/ murein hydrolase activator NlpD